MGDRFGFRLLMGAVMIAALATVGFYTTIAFTLPREAGRVSAVK